MKRPDTEENTPKKQSAFVRQVTKMLNIKGLLEKITHKKTVNPFNTNKKKEAPIDPEVIVLSEEDELDFGDDEVSLEDNEATLAEKTTQEPEEDGIEKIEENTKEEEKKETIVLEAKEENEKTKKETKKEMKKEEKKVEEAILNKEKEEKTKTKEGTKKIESKKEKPKKEEKKENKKTLPKFHLSTDSIQYGLIAFLFLLSLVPDMLIYISFQDQEPQTIVQQPVTPIQEPIVETTEITPENIEEIVLDGNNEDEFLGAAPKEEETNTSDGISIVESYFNAFAEDRFADVCSLVSLSKCNPDNEASFTEFMKRKPMNGGYKNLKIWASDLDTDFHSEVICVEYDFNQKFSTVDYVSDVTQRNSYYIKEGVITAQVCEKRVVDGYEYTCPVVAKRDFCL